MKEAHDKALSASGGRRGIRDANLIESALGSVYSGYHKTAFDKAAALLHGLVRNHPFIDGNKRSASLTTILFLERSGYELPAAIEFQQEFADIVEQVALRTVTVRQLKRWISEHAARRK